MSGPLVHVPASPLRQRALSEQLADLWKVAGLLAVLACWLLAAGLWSLGAFLAREVGARSVANAVAGGSALRLAYRGLVGGLIGGYFWLALVFLLAAPAGDVLVPARVLTALLPSWAIDSRPEVFLLGVGAAQAAGGTVGVLFAVLLARHFTMPSTVNVAAPAFALIVWLGARQGLVLAGVAPLDAISEISIGVASVVYGLVLGSMVPTRFDVTREPATS